VLPATEFRQGNRARACARIADYAKSRGRALSIGLEEPIIPSARRGAITIRFRFSTVEKKEKKEIQLHLAVEIASQESDVGERASGSRKSTEAASTRESAASLADGGDPTNYA